MLFAGAPWSNSLRRTLQLGHGKVLLMKILTLPSHNYRMTFVLQNPIPLQGVRSHPGLGGRPGHRRHRRPGILRRAVVLRRLEQPQLCHRGDQEPQQELAARHLDRNPLHDRPLRPRLCVLPHHPRAHGGHQLGGRRQRMGHEISLHLGGGQVSALCISKAKQLENASFETATT